jgi:hypothetical protein
MNGSIQGTAHRILTVHFFDDTTNIPRNREAVVNEDSPNHQDSLLGLHLAPHVAAEGTAARLDIPRCQRGGKCAL